MGDIESFGADPRRIEYAGASLPRVTINWKEKYKTSLETIKRNYAHFEVPYNGKDNDDYVNGEGFCCSQNTALRAGKGIGNVNNEKMQYYYHPDHLGSSSNITNLDGEIVQHVEYVPFGEVFIEERNNSWNSPYLFNGKELDEETGLYYYGARYYNPRESVWLSADPLSGYNPNNETEHYIDGQHNGGVYNSFNLNTYGYCYQSPVKLVDPNGKQASSVYGLDSAELLNSSNFNTSTSKMTGAFYGTGRTLNYLGNNNIPVSGKLGTNAGTVTAGTSRASMYFRKALEGVKTSNFIYNNLPKKIHDPFTGKNSPLRSNNLGAVARRLTPVLGRGLIVGGVGMSIYNISISDNKPIAAIRKSGIWGGAIAGAESGAILGGAIGGPLGAAAGGIGGGILGGIAGESAVNSLLEPITPCDHVLGQVIIIWKVE